MLEYEFVKKDVRLLYVLKEMSEMRYKYELQVLFQQSFTYFAEKFIPQ